MQEKTPTPTTREIPLNTEPNKNEALERGTNRTGDVIERCPSIKSKGSKHGTHKSKVSSTASSKRRLEVEMLRLQENFELQSRIDEERLALERKAIDMKEQREKKLLDEKFQAMQDMPSSDGGSTVKSKTTVQSQKSEIAKSNVASWLEVQRRQNQTRMPDQRDNDGAIGFDLSIPV